MPSVPRHLELPSFVEKTTHWLSANLNFYRVHVMCFTIIPLIFSGIMFACNTEFQIPYIDCLFLCFSSMCVTGLATVNLSTLSTFQQFIMYFQMLIGSSIFVSIIMVSVRKHFFRVQFRHVLKERDRKHRALDLARTITKLPGQTGNALRRRFTRRPDDPDLDGTVDPSGKLSPEPPKKKKGPFKVTKDMIQRVDGGGVGLVNPMGWYGAGTPTASAGASRAPTPDHDAKVNTHGAEIDHINHADVEAHPMRHIQSPGTSIMEESPMGTTASSPVVRATSRPNQSAVVTTDDEDEGEDDSDRNPKKRLGSDNESNRTLDSYKLGANLAAVRTNDSIPRPATGMPAPSTSGSARTPYAGLTLTDDAFPRSKTIAFEEGQDGMEHQLFNRDLGFGRTPTMRSTDQGDGLRRWTTTDSNHDGLRRTQSRFQETKNTGFGGFPTPIEVIGDVVHKLFPKSANRLHQSITMPRTNTLSGRGSVNGDGTEVPYLTFSATVGRNSHFQNLTQEQMDELGGVEYRALKLLFWVVLSYWVFLPLAGATVIAPYIAAGNRYDYVFNDQPKHVRIPWFSFFQATSGFSNTGVSLVDLSMVPFQQAYLMSFIVAGLILLGNTCFPIMLRFILWLMYKMVPATSSHHESLKFLLDHPRRCFIYLFPSTHTWFLLIVVFVLTMIDWWSFLVLDRGNPVIEALPIGTRVAAGLFQSCAVRAAGFAIVPMNAVAPAVKVLYVVMMYVSVYPIAMSVRATNVYEERALGLYDDEDEDEDADEDGEFEHGEGAHAVAKYVGWHARRQLAFDMWWICLALWLVCIIERDALTTPAFCEWMNVFNIIFELVSAYGTVGLSLGLPYDNYSLSGGFRKLSKLVVIIVMLRGRHRGLPVAIDRAVMLPKDFTESDERMLESRLRRSRSRRASSYGGDMMSMTGSMAVPQTFSNDATDSDLPPPVPASASGFGFTSTVQPPSPRMRRASSSSMRGDAASGQNSQGGHPGALRHVPIHRRTGSTSDSVGTPSTPTALHFSPGATGPHGHSALASVPEARSRRPTAEGGEGADHSQGKSSAVDANVDVSPKDVLAPLPDSPNVSVSTGASGSASASTTQQGSVPSDLELSSSETKKDA